MRNSIELAKTANTRRALAALALLIPVAANAVLLSEGFEGGGLDPRISLTTVGGYSSSPGIKPLANFGSSSAFGFGRSFCGANCFDAHVTGMSINLGTPTLVSTLSFKEMELFGNWGSGGAIFLDGVIFGTSHYDYGRPPYNDLVADTTYRSHTFNIDRSVTTIELRVRDITSSSELYVDDLVLAAVPEPNSGLMLLGGTVMLLTVVRRTLHSRRRS